MADQRAVSPNAAQIEFWNGAASRAWADQYERMDRAVADLTTALLDMAAPQPGEHVLDIGCGSGTTVLELAARVGPGGHVLGADISNQSAARARQRIADAGSRHVEVIVADVSCHAFAPNTFDLVFSRFGVMFFSDPQAAFANVRRAMKAGGGDWHWLCSARPARVCGRTVRWRLCATCCPRSLCPGRRSQALSPGLIPPACIESCKAPASARFP